MAMPEVEAEGRRSGEINTAASKVLHTIISSLQKTRLYSHLLGLLGQGEVRGRGLTSDYGLSGMYVLYLYSTYLYWQSGLTAAKKGV